LKEETLWEERTGDLPYIDPNKTETMLQQEEEEGRDTGIVDPLSLKYFNCRGGNAMLLLLTS
jgi:hypothetical protein